MATAAEIDAEIARRKNQPSIDVIDAEIEKREGGIGFLATVGGTANLLASGMVSGGKQSLEGLSMLGGVLSGQGVDKSIDSARSMSSKIPDLPMGENAKSVASNIGEKFQQSPQVLKDFVQAGSQLSDTAGDIGQAIGGPVGLGATFAAAASTIPEALASVPAFRGAKPVLNTLADAAKVSDATVEAVTTTTNLPAISAAHNVAAETQRLIPSKREIRSSLESGTIDRDTAQFRLTKQGFVVKDPLFKKAVNEGVDEGLVAVLRNASATDRKKMLQMVNMRQMGRKNPLIEGANRPSKIAGASLLERVDLIRGVNKQAGQAIDVESRNLKGKKIDFGPVADEFMSDLDELDISIDPASGKADFSQSILNDNPAARKLINSVVRRMGKGDSVISRLDEPAGVDAYAAHELKRLIDDQVTFGKTKTGLGGVALRVVKKFRAGIDSTLDNHFPAYDEANTAYRETIQVLNELERHAGKQMDLTSSRSANAAGQLMRGIMSNNKSSNSLIELMSEVEDVAKKHGGQFSDDIAAQSFFANELDRLFGASARTSFQGQVEQGGEAVIDSFTTGGAGTAKRLLKSINRKKGAAENERFKTLRDLLKAEE